MDLNLRKFTKIEAVQELLTSKLKTQPQINSYEEFPDQYLFKDMEKAQNLFINAISNNKKIIIICDSDTDGLSTYVISWFFFKDHFNYDNVELYITNRNEGYGFLPFHVERYPGDLYITFDNGITASEAIKAALDTGANVIINDHHQIDPDNWPLYPEESKDRVAVVDPWQPEDQFPFKDISGAVVCWYFYKTIAEKYNLKIDMYHEFLSEMALTSISDVMPLDRHISRFVVKDFLENKKAQTSKRQYIKTFLDTKNNEPNAEDIAFGLVPCLNATQRITKADDGAVFLIQEDADNSLKWMEYLDKINDTRKERQQLLLDYIEKTYKDYLPNKNNNLKFIMIPGKFHSGYKGVLGIIAGRLAEKYRCPAIVLNYNESNKSYSGSGRSVGSINILELFRKPNILPHLTHVGGHKQALGIGIPEDKLNEVYSNILEEANKLDDSQFIPIVKSVGYIDLKSLDIDWYYKLNEFEPFGHMFPRPSFTSKVIVKKTTLIGKQKNHLIMEVTDEKKNMKFKALWFFHGFVPIEGKEYYLTFKPDIDDFRGEAKLALRVLHLDEINNSDIIIKDAFEDL